MAKDVGEDEVYEALEAAVAKAGSMKALADTVGISLGYLNDVRKKRPGRAVSGELATFLGFERLVVYRKKAKE